MGAAELENIHARSAGHSPLTDGGAADGSEALQRVESFLTPLPEVEWAGGAIYDLTGSYLWAFALAVAGLGFGVYTIWRVRPTGDRRTKRSH